MVRQARPEPAEGLTTNGNWNYNRSYTLTTNGRIQDSGGSPALARADVPQLTLYNPLQMSDLG